MFYRRIIKKKVSESQRRREKKLVWQPNISRRGVTLAREEDSLEDKNGSWSLCGLTNTVMGTNMIKRIEVYHQK